MGLDLLAPLFVKAPSLGRPIWPFIVGESSMGKVQPGNYRAMVKADNSWVYACARINAQSVAKVKMRLFRRSGTGDDEEVDDHVLLDLMRNVNPYMNEFELKELTVLFLELVGNSYWYMAPTRLAGRNGAAIPGEIWPLLSQYVRVVPGRTQLIDGYLYQLPQMARPVAFTPDEIVHFKYPHPDSVFYGKGPLEGGHFAVDSNEYQKQYEITLFKNMARPDGVLSTEKELSDPQVERLRAMWNSLHQGTSRSGNIAILEKGLKYENTAFNPKELDYLRGRVATREEICSMFGVPGSKLGLIEDVNRANAEANDFTYQNETVLPRLIRIAEKINERITPIYDSQLYAKFDDPVPQNNEAVLAKNSAYLDRGVYVINEIRAQEGDDPVPWGDAPFSMTLGPVSTDEPMPQPTDQPPADGGDGQDTEDPQDQQDDEDQERMAKAFSFARSITPIERGLRRDLQEYFVQQRRIVDSNLRDLMEANTGKSIAKGGYPLITHVLFSVAKEAERLAKRVRPFIEAGVKHGAQIGVAQVDGKKASGQQVDFDILNPDVLRAIEARVKFFSKRVNEHTAKELTDTIKQGVELGENMTDIASRVDDVYDQLLGFRSLRIARTETVSAANSGMILSYRAAGIDRKRWVTANDEAVRDTHEKASGQTVALAKSFNVGGVALDHPGDPNGPPEEIINCRCSVEPVFGKG